MKKTLGSALASLVYLAYTAPAAFAVSLDPCAGVEDTTKTGWESLCVVSAGGVGSVIRQVVFGILVIATVVALFFLIWGGFKWLTSGGDKAKVEAARSTIIAAIVGLIIAFLSFFILTLVLGFFGISLGNLELPAIRP